MPRRPPSFTKGDAVRALKAAISAGIPHPRIEINREGTISIMAGEPVKNGGSDANSLDQWIEKHADQAEGH
jgi:hypothetical protein